MSRVPERPQEVADLDLLRRLKDYSQGVATWHADKQPLGSNERAACEALYANLTNFISRCLHPLMDRITSREMQGFTMHDHGHGLKVAHLMWHITLPQRREHFSPAEIALLVMSAHLHDLGMGLSDEERQARLHPNSDLWEKVDPESFYSTRIQALFALKDNPSAAVRTEALFQAQQAQEALLCADSRDRHATYARYQELFQLLSTMNNNDPDNIPDIRHILSFDGDSFKEKLIDICVSHNEDAHVLLNRHYSNSDQWRFPTEYPVGCCVADTRFVAAALRLADILDFDRERTPPILFHYLLPRSANPSDNVSVREWSKHLSISNWEIDSQKLLFRGRSPSAFIHHTVIQFCSTIEEEIGRTQSALGTDEWPFVIQPNVKADIEATGYRYIPYAFSLDEERLYELLMGRNIYDTPLHAIRELIQNSVDSCRLRDALMHLYEDSVTPTTENRIIVDYQEETGSGDPATVRIIDSGLGMDRYVIENYFLKVGRSYYKSAEFVRTRSALRRSNLDFSPVSEFGIGFLAVFMLGDRVTVDTALSYPIRNDSLRRTLRIDGVGRLIEVAEQLNNSVPRFQGTSVTVQLSSSSANYCVPTYAEVEKYLKRVCFNLPYPIRLRHVSGASITEINILPQGLKVRIPDHLKESAISIDVDDLGAGITGQIILFRQKNAQAAEAALAAASPSIDQDTAVERQILIRGGFAVGHVRSLPRYIFAPAAAARIEVTWQNSKARLLPQTNLGRTDLADHSQIEQAILKAWIEHLLENIRDIERRPLGTPLLYHGIFHPSKWLEHHDAYLVYRLARTSWANQLNHRKKSNSTGLEDWEKSKGPPLPLGWPHDTLHAQLLDLLLPHISELRIGGQAVRYAMPPRKRWRATLRGLTGFVTKRKDWGQFAEYVGAIKPVLYDQYPGNRWLNKRFEKRFEGFSEVDLADLIKVFDNCISAKRYGYPARLGRSEFDLLRKAVALTGDLKVSDLDKAWSIKEFARS